MIPLLSITPLAGIYIPGQTAEIVLWIFAILALVTLAVAFTLDKWKEIWENLSGEYDENGMRRMLMFNKQPYMAVAYIAMAIVVSAAFSAFILFAVGGIGYGLLWFVKILLWGLIIIGYILLAIGVLCLIGMQPVGCLPVLIGGVIVYYKDNIETFANDCVEAGFNFYSALNLWELGKFAVTEYGMLFLIIALTPIMLGVAAAIITMIVAGAFMLVEYVMTSKYNIKHPCPFCHNPSEPATYLSEGYELPIKLRPGPYGLFHIKHPQTEEEMPTMLLNGRDSLERMCPHCKRIINYQTGVEKHIAFVGLPESGKTCLTYRFVGNMMRRFAEVTFTDQVSKEAQKIITDIKEGKEQEIAAQTSINDMRRSLQILVPGKAPLPYHFFINDIGGELFTNVKSDYMQFFKDVEVVSILVDPFTMDFTEYDIDGDFAAWYNETIAKKAIKPTSKLSDVIHSVKALSDQFTHATDKIHVNLILVKADTGYVPQEMMDDEAQLKDFFIQQLGMAAEVNNLENTYASLHFFAVSALKNIGVDKMTDSIIENLKVKL